MTKHQPLENKTLKFEQDYIETEIKWDLKLGDDIFKRIDVKRAIMWLKSEIKTNSKDETYIYLDKLNLLLTKAFYDVIKIKAKIRIQSGKDKQKTQ